MLQVENSLTCRPASSQKVKSSMCRVSTQEEFNYYKLQKKNNPPNFHVNSLHQISSLISSWLSPKKTLFFEAFHFTRLKIRVLYYRRETERLNAVITMPVRTAQ